MPRARQIPLQVDASVSERTGRFSRRRLERPREVSRIRNDAHAFAATARGGFQEHRIANFIGGKLGCFRVGNRFG